MRAAALCLLSLLLAGPVFADLSFIQVVQGQDSRGKDGFFGKSWAEIRGRRMRLVSGYARKVKGDTPADPRRVIQLVDLEKDVRYIIRPETETYIRAPVGERGGWARTGRPGRKAFRRVDDWDIKLEKRGSTRRFLGVSCLHFKLTAEIRLSGPGGRRRAVMEQHLWAAPLTKSLSKSLLELMAFENEHRNKAGGALSPLDAERYQVPAAASHLRVPAEQLRRVIVEARARARDLPSYPVGSLVTWRVSSPEAGPGRTPGPKEGTSEVEPENSEEARSSAGAEKGSKPPGLPSRLNTPGFTPHKLGSLRESDAPGLRRPRMESSRERRARRHRARLNRFRPMDWLTAEKQINRIYGRTRREMGAKRRRGRPSGRKGPFGRERSVYPRFGNELQGILRDLVDEQDRLARELEVSGGGETSAEKPKTPREKPEAPAAGPLVKFYEIYAELSGLEGPAVVPEEDLRIPEGYAEEKAGAGRGRRP